MHIQLYCKLYLLFLRYLVAAKNIEPGEVIIREEPIVVGPMIYRKDCFCFACLRSLTQIGGKKQYVCSKCNVASLCSLACEVTSYIHKSIILKALRMSGKNKYIYYTKQRNIFTELKKLKYLKRAKFV